MGRNLIATVLAAALLAGTPALAAGSDRSTTRHFIAEATVWLTAVENAQASEQAAIDAVITHISSTCPATLASDKGDTSAQADTGIALIEAASIELALAQLAPVSAQATTFGAQLQALRWTSPKLNRAVAGIARQGLRALRATPPDVCREVATAAISGFAKVPPDTARFLKETGSASTSTIGDVLKLAKPYLTSRADKAAASRLATLERRLRRDSSKIAADAGSRLSAALLGPAAAGPSPTL